MASLGYFLTHHGHCCDVRGSARYVIHASKFSRVGVIALGPQGWIRALAVTSFGLSNRAYKTRLALMSSSVLSHPDDRVCNLPHLLYRSTSGQHAAARMGYVVHICRTPIASKRGHPLEHMSSCLREAWLANPESSQISPDISLK